MFEKAAYSGTKEENYQSVAKQLYHLIDGEPNVVANLSNAAAILNHFLIDINWVGFYLFDGTELVLGPFQGLPACIRIPIGRGVCGTSAAQLEVVRVEDVHQFPGHIACDAASQSEIVLPILKNGELFGVLDIDSPIKGRFDEIDEAGLRLFVETLEQSL
jgi:GAF domain-containing protein